MSLTDSTDWLTTPLSALAPLDAALRCQVCKDFFTTPMITSCSHTFCSLCIRRCLSQDGRCPVCREQDQEMRLRRNWAVEELVANFSGSREGLLGYAKDVAEEAQHDDLEVQRPKKRRKFNGEATIQPVERRSTRSQSRRDVTQASQESTRSYRVEVVEDSEDGSESNYEGARSSPKPKPAPEPEDGLVACPMCSKRMKEALVYPHLDTCTGTSSDAPFSPPKTSDHFQAGSIAYTLPKITKTKDRLPTINYALLSENQLRKKLKDLGIPTIGPRMLLQKRHTEWLNLWNANCDSRQPRPKQKLLSDLETWERTQGRQILNHAGPSGVMIKDFDREAYARSNRSDFDDLIRKAREKKSTPQPVESGAVQHTDAEPPLITRQEIFAPGVPGGTQEAQDTSARNGQDVDQNVIACSQKRTVDTTSSKLPLLETTQSQGSRTNDIAV